MTITLTREEAQQVLDALNDVRYRIDFGQMNLGDDTDAAIETLRTRLAQPEPKNKALTHEENKAHNQKILDEFYKENAALYEPEPAKLLLIPALMEQAGWVRKREWQGLTDEERLRCFDDVDWNKVDWCPDHEQYAKAVEAKLKEKNT